MEQSTNYQDSLIGYQDLLIGKDTVTEDEDTLGTMCGIRLNFDNYSTFIKITGTGTFDYSNTLDSEIWDIGDLRVSQINGIDNFTNNMFRSDPLGGNDIGGNDTDFAVILAPAVSSTVVTNTNDSGTGSLRDVIATAKSGDVITFAPNLANQTITLTSGEIMIAAGKSLIIEGANAANLTVSGNNNSRIFHPLSNVNKQTDLTIRNLTLANGFSNEGGGAIQTEDLGSLTVENVTFENNVATKNGASISTNSRSGGITVIDSRFENNQAISINNERSAGAISFVGFAPGGSNLVVQGSDFIGNQGINGGAINVINGRVTIEDSRFINNDTTAAFFATGNIRDFLRGHGGALHIDRVDDSLIIRNSKFEGNRGEGQGGAINVFTDPEDTVTIENTVFRDNQVSALTGGGMKGKGGAINHVRNSLNAAGSLTITSSSFVDNVASFLGGGLWVNQTNSKISNTTFSNNSSNSFGGAIWTSSPVELTNATIANNSAKRSGAVDQGGKSNLVTVRNTIFANNTATSLWGINRNPQAFQPMTNGGGNLQFPDGPKLFPGVRIANPNLGVIQEVNDTLVHPLQSGSGAIDAGVNAGAPATDQRGELRPQDGDGNGSAIVDIGAFEFGTSGSVTLNSTSFNDNLIGDNLIGLAGNDSII